MSEKNIFELLKEWVGEIGFKVFLWSHGWTNEQYFDIIDGPECEARRTILQSGGRQ